MQWEIERYSAPDYFRINFFGRFEILAFRDVIHELVNHPDWQPGSSILADERQFQVAGVDPREILEASNTLIRNNRHFLYSKLALLMGTPEDFRTATKFMSATQSASPLLIEVFSDEAEALKWLSEDEV